METVTFSEFAALQGWQKSYVTKLRQAGRLVLVEGRVDVAASKARIHETESGAKQHSAVRRHWKKNRDKTSPPPENPPAPPPDIEDDDSQNIRGTRAYWDRREAAARAEMREIELAKMKGVLIAREDVDFVLNDFGATWRGLLENLPDRLAPQVYPLTTLEETHTAIVEASEELQREMAETMKRRIEGMEK